MNEITINYKDIVLVPLILLKRKINSEEINEYINNIYSIYERKGTKVNFKIDNSSKSFFEITHLWWISTIKSGNITEYEIKYPESESREILIREIDSNIIEVLSTKEALTAFDPFHKLAKLKKH